MSNTEIRPNLRPAMESPCLNICVMDEASSQCIGCGRTRREIAMWSSISSAERRRIMEELPNRQKAKL
jgi:uncharacterized protein